MEYVYLLNVFAFAFCVATGIRIMVMEYGSPLFGALCVGLGAINLPFIVAGLS